MLAAVYPRDNLPLKTSGSLSEADDVKNRKRTSHSSANMLLRFGVQSTGGQEGHGKIASTSKR